MLTIVMYHYVRDSRHTDFPRIKGLSTQDFDGQLDYIGEHYSVCGMGEVIAASRGLCQLPPNACLLTFDDGLSDHYRNVLPRLLDRGFKGSFFPSVLPTEEDRVLDVHKIQFVLASTMNHLELAQELLRHVDVYRTKFVIPTGNQLVDAYAVPGRFDCAEVIFIKRMLQRVLPEPVRSEITDMLFKKYVSADEATFARELYMSIPQMQEMVASGMEIGGHGHHHRWLGELSLEEQQLEIRSTISFLADVYGKAHLDWVMCYPYGSFNADTIRLMRENACGAGLTTKVGLARLDNPLEFERLDTNDLPVVGDAPVNQWTKLLRDDCASSAQVVVC